MKSCESLVEFNDHPIETTGSLKTVAKLSEALHQVGSIAVVSSFENLIASIANGHSAIINRPLSIDEIDQLLFGSR